MVGKIFKSIGEKYDKDKNKDKGPTGWRAEPAKAAHTSAPLGAHFETAVLLKGGSNS